MTNIKLNIFLFLLRMSAYTVFILIIPIAIVECFWRRVTLKDQLKSFVGHWKWVGSLRA